MNQGTGYPQSTGGPPGMEPGYRPRMVSVRPPVTYPYVTYTILGLTIGVFLLQLLTQQALGRDLPALLGMKINQLIEAGQWWRLFTPALLHQNIIHIGFNMYALYLFGRGLEQYYGHARFSLLYLVSALAGNVLSFLFSPNPSLGASTAVFGLVAAEGIFVLRNRSLYGRRAASILTNIGLIVAVNLFLGLRPGIDNWGHLGGLIGGLAYSLLGGPVMGVAEPDYSVMVPGQYTLDYRLEDTTSGGRGWLAAIVVGGVFLALAILKILG